MSPTCTIPYEVMFELTNNTPAFATMQVLRHEDGSGTGATILLHKGENISLVLTAGLPYKYAVKQRGIEANLSVKAWQDTQCRLSDVFSAKCLLGPNDELGFFVMDGITATFFARPQVSTFQ